MRNQSLIALGKSVSRFSKLANRGNGSTWPGHIALQANKNFIKDVISKSSVKTIIVAGTNGKTTTASLIKKGLIESGKTVFQNQSGANLLNGIASTVLLHASFDGKLNYDYAIFEVDENSLPLVLKQVNPDYLVLLNLFRDQLDRYGEIHTIVKKWQDAIAALVPKTTFILNADDVQIATIPVFLGISEKNILYFSVKTEGKNANILSESADSVTCPKCGNKLTFETVVFSHLGKWHCTKCGLKRPNSSLNQFTLYPLSGMYNKYNTNAAALVLEQIGLDKQVIEKAFSNFTPAFGRQETISYKNRKIQLFLSKNPTSFNQSFATIQELGAKNILFILNDRIPDGRDISWIWDTNLNGIDKFKKIIISGDRTYDMALRIQYEHAEKWNRKNGLWNIEPDLEKALTSALSVTHPSETLYILPTYSAMLDVRKIITGKKIL